MVQKQARNFLVIDDPAQDTTQDEKQTNVINEKLLQTLVDRVVEVSKLTNQDKVIEMLEADKQKLQTDLARQKDKNKKLKEKLNELYQAMQKQNSDRFAQIMQHVSTFKREMISLRELLTKTCQNFQKVSDSAEI